MGGCRCTFRSCTVNTLKFPGMHFFHFPLKNKERLEKWIKYANYPHFKELSTAQAKNKVVCALHFRDECFMNYKKDRLIPQAIPTLDRLRNGLVIDYSSDNPKPSAIPPTTEKHLIPPKGFVALGLPEDFFSDCATNMEMLEEDEEEVTEPLVKRPKIKIDRAPKILNKGVRLRSISPINGNMDGDEISTMSINEETFEEEEYTSVIPIVSKCDSTRDSLSPALEVNASEVINLDEIEFLSSDKVDCVEIENSVSKALYDQTVDAFESGVAELKQEWNKKECQINARVEHLEAELEEAKERAELALTRAEKAETSAKDWQSKLEAANRELAKQTVTSKPKSVVPAFGQLTKPQLFNGIKKYLSASMTALVRMEMFSATDRQWKPDEKQASVELLRLGERVYKYFSDEWRFRLPPKQLVNEWMNEGIDENEDDL